MKTMFKNFADDTQGATAIEYGLIAALIAVAAVTAMGTLGKTIKNTLDNTSGKMSNTTVTSN